MYLVLMRTYLFFNRTFIYNWYDILNFFSRLGVTIGCRLFITQSLHRLLQSTCTWSAIMMNTPTGLMCRLQNQSKFFLTYTWCGRPAYEVKFLSSRGREWGRIATFTSITICEPFLLFSGQNQTGSVHFKKSQTFLVLRKWDPIVTRLEPAIPTSED